MEFKSIVPKNKATAKLVKSFNLNKSTVDRLSKYCSDNGLTLSYTVDTILDMYLTAIDKEGSIK